MYPVNIKFFLALSILLTFYISCTIKPQIKKGENLFNTSFPYSSGIHQAPTDGKLNLEWQLHMHFYPPLLRSATVKKFMVGYEMMGESQRDITPEKSAEALRNCSDVHYRKNLGLSKILMVK